MTTEERIAALEDTLASQAAKLDDIAARLMKLEAILSDRHVGEALEGWRREGWIRDAIRPWRGEENAKLYPHNPALAVDEAPF